MSWLLTWFVRTPLALLVLLLVVVLWLDLGFEGEELAGDLCECPICEIIAVQYEIILVFKGGVVVGESSYDFGNKLLVLIFPAVFFNFFADYLILIDVLLHVFAFIQAKSLYIV